MKLIAPLLLALLVLTGCHSTQPKPAAPPVTPAPIKPTPPPPLVRPTAFWPLATGTSWTYAGTLISLANGVITTNAVRLSCAVQEAQTLRGHQLARLSSFPPALSPWEAVPTNTPYVLLRTPAGAWHAIEATRARPVLARLADSKDALDDLLTFETQVLAEPLRDGLRWGDPVAMQRLDGIGCWVVSAPHTASLAKVAGLPKSWKLDIFPLAFRTNPDQLEVQFAPNIGLLASDYVHHGTPGEVHLRLVEFHPTPPPPSPAQPK
jgi:hypothetical protein